VKLAYAIDFGTTNSLISAADENGVLPPIPVDPSSPDPTIMRTILYSPSKDKWFYGAGAIDTYGEMMADGRLFRSIKKYLPDESFTGTSIHGKRFTLHDLISVFLAELRDRANRHFDKDVESVVLGRPAAFSLNPAHDEIAQNRLKAAALQAGFKNVEFCPEPIAAAHEFRHTLTEPKTVLIADFGGGTSDFTVLKMSNTPFNAKDVMAVGGIPVAGDMFDGAIMKHMICPHFGTKVEYKLPLGSVTLKLPKNLINRMCSPADISFLARNDIQNLLKDAQRWSLAKDDAQKMNHLFMLIEEHLGYKLFSSIEDTKIRLSENDSAIFNFKHYEIDIEEEIFSSDFRVAAHDQVERITTALDKTIKDAGIDNSQVDIVCCTGGTAKNPALNYELSKRFGKEKLQQHKHFHSVIGGLAERAYDLFIK
jgi:hypothetical chaperone protein